ncbi:MAG: AAA family ATPase [Candidatus Schekmanbacteria bacterium]|nr:AAA family ATPase [Candidatus Schekmanbacteria bacterium]
MELIKYLEIIWRRKYVLIISVLILVALPIFLSKKVIPIYSATSKLMINIKDYKPQIFSNSPDDLGKFNYIQEKNVIDTYQTLIRTRTVVDPVIKELNLKNEDGKLIEGDKFFIDTFSIYKLLSSQKKGVKVAQIESAEIFSITGYSSNPEEAVAIANRVSEKTMDFYFNLNRAEMTKTAAVLKARQKVIVKKLDEYESDVSDIMFKGGFADLSTKKEQLEEQLVSLETKLPALKIELTEKHPDVLSIIKQIETVKKQLAAIPVMQMRLNEIQRKMDVLDNSNKMIDEQIAIAEMLSEMDITNAILIQRAKPSFDPANDIYLPNTGMVLGIGGGLSIVIGLFLIFTLEYFDTTYKAIDPVRKDFSGLILGIVPLVSWPFVRWVTFYWNKRFLDSIGDIGSGIIKTGNKVTGIFSPTQGDGKSVISSYLARVIAERGKRVVLIDADFFQSRLKRYFRLKSKPGLKDYLDKKASLEEVIKSSNIKGLDIIPLGKGKNLPSMYLGMPEFKELIDELKSKYDFIIMDCTSLVRRNIFTNSLASHVEIPVMVVSLFKTEANHFKESLNILSDSGIPPYGIVINRARDIRTSFSLY